MALTNALPEAEAARWCGDRGIEVEGVGASTRLRFSHPTSSLRLTLGPDALRTFGLSYVLLMTSVPDDDESKFPGALVWMTEYGLWGETTERLGLGILQRIRTACGQNQSLENAPAQLFGSGDVSDVHAAVALPMLFQWDAYFVPSGAEWIAFMSHHGSLDVMPRSDALLQALAGRFRKSGWESVLRP